jgi:hypothetical protein
MYGSIPKHEEARQLLLLLGYGTGLWALTRPRLRILEAKKSYTSDLASDAISFSQEM